MKRLFMLGLVLLLTVVALPHTHQSAVAQEAGATCVDNYEEGVDYFPAKVEPTYAAGFSVEYFNNYKVVTVDQPWVGATEDDAFVYVLVQCGTPAPEGFDSAQIIEVPGGDVISMSTTQLPHLVELGVLDSLIGVDSYLYINTPEVLDLIDNGDLVEVGSGASVNIETVLDAEPDMVMTYASGFAEYDAHPLLLDADITVVINAEWIEVTPLARAEWIKFTSTFFNAEEAANEVFGEIETEYNALVELTADIEDRPSVLTGTYTSFGETWNIAGTESFVGTYIRDAGAEQVFAEHEDVAGSTGTAFFDFETVYLEGLEADYWLPNVFGVSSLDALSALDERYADFVAFSEGHVYTDNARENENGGNDVYESGVLNPHIVLADLISIFHPELLPDHELVYYRHLQ